MRNHRSLIPSLALLAACCLASAASAASMALTYQNNAYAFYLNAGEYNGAFDTIYFQAKATPPSVFANLNTWGSEAFPQPPGNPFTYYNRLLSADPLEYPGAVALTQIGTVITAQELSFAVGKLGGTISTVDQPYGYLFLANVYQSGAPGWVATLQMLSAGTIVQEFHLVTPLTPPGPQLPEPASVAMFGVGTLALSTIVRRRPAVGDR
ncbi:MAG: PEP-CTERM sorting domain-containing protein [Planctomycetaceae bacterium]|nr:PEP-CTERM sorting domain-containing protein [Planctomycetaceae bacterium]